MVVASADNRPTDNAATPLPEPESIIVTNPATGEVIRALPNHSPAFVQSEMRKIREAAPTWGALPVRERCRRMAQVRDVIHHRSEDIVKVVTEENGKVRQEALLHDLGATLQVMNYFIEHAPRILSDERLHLALPKYRRSYLAYRPKGVMGVITPWNFPFFMPGCDVAMSMIAGSGVILKPSEVTPLSALILKECYDEAGIDPNLFRVVTGLGGTGAALIDSMPDHVVFTGSVPTGRRIGVACAERFIGYTLELGGKAPAVVLDDADVERTASAITWGGFANAGQICASVERVYATPGVYDELVEQVTKQVAALRVGPPADGEVDIGAMTFPRQLEIVAALIADAKDKGARITTGGEIPDEGRGLFCRPTVVADCNHDMAVMNDEIFGPVVPIMKVGDVAEAVRMANKSHLGLGAYVFTSDRERGRQVAEQLEVGSVMINDVLSHAGMAEMPWGGIKQSGLGVVRSERGLQALCDARHVNEERFSWPLKRDPYWFPYSAASTEGVAQFVKMALGGTVGGKLLRRLLR